MAQIIRESKQAKRERIRAECREFGIKPWEYHPEEAPATRPFSPGFAGYDFWPKANALRREMRATGLTFRELMATKQQGATP